MAHINSKVSRSLFEMKQVKQCRIQSFKFSGVLKMLRLLHQAIVFVFNCLLNILPNSILNTFLLLNHDMPNLIKTKQSVLFSVSRYQSQISRTLPLYIFPIMWNRRAAYVTTLVSRFQFKVRTIINIDIKRTNTESSRTVLQWFITIIMINNIVYQFVTLS